VQPLVAWLVARPQNAVLGLAATLLLPVLQVLSGIFMVLLVLRQGVRLAVIEGAIAASLLALIAVVAAATQAEISAVALLTQILTGALTTWLPAILLAVALQVTRSLALTLQVSVLVAAAAVLGFHLVVDDLIVFWQPVMEFMISWARNSQLHEQVQLIESDPAVVAHTLTIVFVLSSWTMYVVYLLFGYRLSTAVPGEFGSYGRFCDLNFGRVIAAIMALASLLAFVSGMASLQSVAIVLFGIFWLQGLAVVHWMFEDSGLPLFVVILTYVLMPFLHVFLFLALAVLGYTDAWFRYRRRAVAQQ
jgi:hypothetical protein